MNFYSDLINNGIADNSPIETLIDELEEFKKNSLDLLLRLSRDTLLPSYTKNALTDNIVAFHCLNTVFDLNDCPSIMIYHKEKKNYYILFVCTSFRFRGQGYATRLLDGFVERVKKEGGAKIILSSVYDSVLFYETYGFKWLGNCIKDYPILLNYEKYEEDKEYFIMEYLL